MPVCCRAIGIVAASLKHSPLPPRLIFRPGDTVQELHSQRRYGSVQQAADLIGVSGKTIRRRIADGTISAYKFGPRLLRVDLDQVERALTPIPTAVRGRR